MNGFARCMRRRSVVVFLLLVATACSAAQVQGELKKWHKVTLTFVGPQTQETAEPNPFLYYRLNVTFTHSDTGKVYVVPGYFAADGKAGQTSATSGNKWRVHFAPDEVGLWQYEVSFRKGTFMAVRSMPDAGESASFMDRERGSLDIAPTDKTGRDFRAQGRLQYVGKHHLRFAETGKYFLKCGADAPENFLAYADFDGDFHNDGHQDNMVKTWKAHVQDWQHGDPTWKRGKGKGMIGALNYLAGEGMNVFSFLPLNIKGDDQNVYPYISYEEYERFDCSKLDQWEIVFAHATQLGLFLHFKTQEMENQGLLDGGGVGVQRRLYYRELMARFGHHLALNWNLGEENGDWVKNPPTAPQDTPQRRAMAQYFHDHDPYRHHIVIHNGWAFDDMLGDQSHLTGVSVQTDQPDFSHVYTAVKSWIDKSAAAGKPWVVACDEPGDASHSLLPDAEDPNHDNARKNALWGTFMAGGAGIEWYFGYQHAHSDLTCEDWRSRDLMWDQCRYALTFFEAFKIPFWRMSAQNWRCRTQDWVLGGKSVLDQWIFLVYQKNGAMTTLDLPAGRFDFGWFNPRTAQGLFDTGRIDGPGEFHFQAPGSQDWVLLLRQSDNKGVRVVLSALEDFSDVAVEGFAPAYRDRGRQALAMDVTRDKGKIAAASTVFNAPGGSYLVTLRTLTETAGECSYHLYVNDQCVGVVTNPRTRQDYVPAVHTWPNVNIPKGATLRLEFNSVSNGLVPEPEGEAFAFARGCWTGLIFDAPAGSIISAEVDGAVTVEAEHFGDQILTGKRRWYLTSPTQAPDVTPDGDPVHTKGASGAAYLEVLPDTRRSHADPLIVGENYSDEPGRLAVVVYPVYFRTPGRYYVWVRAYSTGSEDNGLHVGLNGEWPESGQHLQWCDGKNTWRWESKQRTETQHCGEPYQIHLDIPAPGLHNIMFSLREDGFKFDKWIMTQDRDFQPSQDAGPVETVIE